MLNYLKRFFSKSEQEEHLKVRLPESVEATFNLKVDNLVVGNLHCKNGEWEFEYTEEFKKNQDKYNRITGFSDLDKIYHSDMLWPFFQTRIPGLKQPAVKEILKNENINETNELDLLKRFGKKTISNPYELDLV